MSLKKIATQKPSNREKTTTDSEPEEPKIGRTMTLDPSRQRCHVSNTGQLLLGNRSNFLSRFLWQALLVIGSSFYPQAMNPKPILKFSNLGGAVLQLLQ